ncbi:RNA-binding protein Hfq [Heyndrickxia ginsengihumi]|uniref:RNA-binding protein Hfq n=1 Tax=Heyndrickxia ginsengihumi TaxID=363870 RepID=A0A0A6VCP1_9BACI|nr:RNA chaperone Hfq [Heyndrickxia ginsengihumi]KHD86075.1 RNA-binding protein Hfq [Heyndrickxia ginsengihumi]
MNKAINIQDQFLNQLRKEGTVVTVFLMNGFQLRGQVKAFDNFTVLFETDGKQQLVFKHAISTFTPQKTFKLMLKNKQLCHF